MKILQTMKVLYEFIGGNNNIRTVVLLVIQIKANNTVYDAGELNLYLVLTIKL